MFHQNFISLGQIVVNHIALQYSGLSFQFSSTTVKIHAFFTLHYITIYYIQNILAFCPPHNCYEYAVFLAHPVASCHTFVSVRWQVGQDRSLHLS